MKRYTSTGARETIAMCREHDIGLLMVHQWRDPSKWPYYAIDNGAYSAWANDREWDPSMFLHLVGKCVEYPVQPDFVVVPDIVAGGIGSLEFSLGWLERLPEGLPYYLAVQDGMVPRNVRPYMDDFAGIFVGGTTEWKMSTAEEWAAFAKRHGKGCHIGRIGTAWRILWARRIGATSIDSTTWVQSKRGWKHIPRSEMQRTLEISESGA